MATSDKLPDDGLVELLTSGRCTFLPKGKGNVMTADVRWTLERVSKTNIASSKKGWSVLSPSFDVRCGESVSRWRVVLGNADGLPGGTKRKKEELGILLLNDNVDSDGKLGEQLAYMQYAMGDGEFYNDGYCSLPMKLEPGGASLVATSLNRAELMKNCVKDDQLIIVVSVTVYHRHQQENCQRLLLVRQPLTIDAGDDCLRRPLLDDPVLAGIKNQLTISSGIGLAPMSRKFSEIALPCKRRMEMHLQELCVFSHSERNYMRLEVKGRNDSFNVDIPMSSAYLALRRIFLNVQRWRTVDLAHHDLVVPQVHHRHCSLPSERRQQGARGIRKTTATSSSPMASADADCRAVRGQFLDAFFAAIGETGHIRRLCCFQMNSSRQKRLVDFLERCAPFLRSLTIGLQGESLPALVPAISTCQQLRNLVVGISIDPFEKFMAPFCRMLPQLPLLNGLRLGSQLRREHLTIDNGHVAFHHDWLPSIDHLAFHPLPKQLQHLNLEWGLGGDDVAFPVDSLRSIIKMMQSPFPIIINHYFDSISLEDLCTDYLSLVFFTRATIHLFLHRGGLRKMTIEEIKGRFSPLSSTMRNALTLPDLKNAKVYADKCYRHLEFRFANGGKLIVKKT